MRAQGFSNTAVGTNLGIAAKTIVSKTSVC